MRKSHKYLLFLLLLGSFQGCGLNPFAPVKPWDRDVLAQDKMQLGAHIMEQIADDKMYFSREASRGGGGLGGGGCGCN